MGAAKKGTPFDPAAWSYKPEEGIVEPKNGEENEQESLFPRSAAKLWRMRERLRDAGFTSWIE
jgi:hypothetical protein